MKQSIRTVLSLLVIILITVPLSIVMTILLSPFLAWLEAKTGIESVGHAGPAEWCYLIIFFLLVTAITSLFFIIQQRNKRK